MSARTRGRSTRQESTSLTDAFDASVMEGGGNMSVLRITVITEKCVIENR